MAAPMRLRLTQNDLARIVLRPGLGPFGEAILSFDMIRLGSQYGVLGPWPRNVRTSVSPLAKHAAVLFKINGPPLDLFTAITPTDDLQVAIDQFMGLPDAVLNHEIESVLARRTLPRWTAPMVGADLTARRLLARAVSDMAEMFVLPYWTQMQSFLRTENSAAAHRFLDRGLGDMLSRLHPCIHWDPPWLTLGCGAGRPREMFARGQGIVLAPAVLSSPHPSVFQSMNDDDPLLIIYPAVKEYADIGRLWNPARDPSAVARLIGQSRADLLMTIEERPGLSVRDLARTVGISTGAASEHMAVLREAGLVSGQRHGKALVHTMTVLGSSFLRPDPPSIGRKPG